MSLKKYQEYEQSIQNGLPKLFKKLGIEFNQERKDYIVNNLSNTIINFRNDMRNYKANDIEAYKQKSIEHMRKMFYDSLNYVIGCKIEDSANSQEKAQDEKDMQFFSNYTSYMQGIFNTIFAPSILDSSLAQIKNGKGINKEFMISDDDKSILNAIFNEATDKEVQLRREGKFTAKELTQRVNNSSYNYDNERRSDEDKLSNLARDYINLKKQYESRGRFERFFTGGASRIAMRKAESRLKAAWKANPNGMAKFDAEKYAIKMAKPTKMFSNLIESFKEENVHLDDKIQRQFEVDKAINDIYTDEERAEINGIMSKYVDTMINNHSGFIDTKNMSIKELVAYGKAVKTWNDSADKKTSGLRQNQVKQLKEYANNLLKTKDDKQLSTIVKMSNSRKQLTDEINKYCTKNNLEIPDLKDLNSDKIIKEWENKKINFSLSKQLGVETVSKINFNDEFKKENDEPLNEINTNKARRKSNIDLDVSISEAGIE